MVTIDHTEKGWSPIFKHFMATFMVISSCMLSSSRGKWQTRNARTKPIQTAAKLSSKIRRLSLQFCTWRSCNLEDEVVLAAAAAIVSTAVAAADSVVSTADNDRDGSAWATTLTRSLTAAVASNETALISGLLLTFKQLFLDPQIEGRGDVDIASLLFSWSGTIPIIDASPLNEGSVMSKASSLSGLRLSLMPRLTKVELIGGGSDPKSDKTLETEGRHVL